MINNIFIDSSFIFLTTIIFLILFYLIVLLFINFHTKVLIQSLILFVLSGTIGIFKFITFGLYSDEQFYFKSALSNISAFEDLNVMLIVAPTTKSSLSITSNLIFEISTINPILIITMNSMLLGLMPSILVVACKNFKIADRPFLIGWITVLCFPLILFTPWYNRESLSFVLLSLVVLSSSFIVSNKVKNGVMLYIILAPILFFTRGQLLLVAIISFGLSIFYFVNSQKKLDSLNNLTKKSWIILPLIFSIIPLFYFSKIYLNTLESSNVAGVIMGNSEPPNSTIPQFASPEFNISPLGFTYNLTRSLFGPFPWEWINVKFFLIGLDGLFYTLIFILIAILYFKEQNKRYLYPLLLIPLIPVWLYSSLTLANYGLNMRIRAHFIPFLVPLIVISVNNIANARIKKRITII